MTSPARKIGRSDIKRWLGMVAIGALAGAINVISADVIPDLEGMGGTVNGTIAITLMLVVDGVRRYLQDTRVVDEDEADNLVVKKGKNKIGVIDGKSK